MYARQPIPEAALVIARRQAGVVTRGQLVDGGLGDSQLARMVSTGIVARLDRGVFVVPGYEAGWRQRAWAGVLLGGSGARLVGLSAGAVQSLCPQSLPICVGVPFSRSPGDRPWVSFLRERPGVRSDWSTGQLPTTLIEDTVLDLCDGAKDDAAVVGIVSTACQRQTRPARLRRALASRQRIRHRALIAAVLTDVEAGAQSPLEVRWIRDVERAHRLPQPIRQFVLPSGRIADAAWKEAQVLLELDGRAHHDGDRRFRDWRRDNEHSESGWLTLRYGWHDVVGDSCAVAGNLARVLTSRATAVTLRRCPRCSARQCA